MCIAFLLTLLVAAPFWEAKPPEQWTQEELDVALHDSPWAQVMQRPTAIGRPPGVQVYLASAKPMRDAEAEVLRRSRSRRAQDSLLYEEYLAFLGQNEGTYIILAVHLPNPLALADAEESRRMEDECVMKVGDKKHKMVGHFPPTPTDPYLRLVYPRVVDAGDKELTFELYLPTLPSPFREAHFPVKELYYNGHLEM